MIVVTNIQGDSVVVVVVIGVVIEIGEEEEI